MSNSPWNEVPAWLDKSVFVVKRARTMGILRSRVNQAKATYKRVSIPPAHGRLSEVIYARSVEGGIVWVRDPIDPRVQIIKKPWDKEQDPDGTIHIIQWDGPEDDGIRG